MVAGARLAPCRSASRDVRRGRARAQRAGAAPAPARPPARASAGGDLPVVAWQRLRLAASRPYDDHAPRPRVDVRVGRRPRDGPGRHRRGDPHLSHVTGRRRRAARRPRGRGTARRARAHPGRRCSTARCGRCAWRRRHTSRGPVTTSTRSSSWHRRCWRSVRPTSATGRCGSEALTSPPARVSVATTLARSAAYGDRPDDPAKGGPVRWRSGGRRRTAASPAEPVGLGTAGWHARRRDGLAVQGASVGTRPRRRCGPVPAPRVPGGDGGGRDRRAALRQAQLHVGEGPRGRPKMASRRATWCWSTTCCVTSPPAALRLLPAAPPVRRAWDSSARCRRVAGAARRPARGGSPTRRSDPAGCSPGPRRPRMRASWRRRSTSAVMARQLISTLRLA